MKKITLITIFLATFATQSFAYCPIPQWCPKADLHQVLCPGEPIDDIEFPSVIGRTLIINWWTDGTRFASINTPDGIIVSGPPDNREHSAPVIIRGTPTAIGTHHYTVSNTCGVELIHGSITVAGPPIIGMVTPTIDQVTPQNIPFANALTLTAEPAGVPPITIQWFSNTTASTTGGTSMGTANGAQTNTFTPPTSATVNLSGVYYYAVATDRCGNTATTSNTSGKHIVVPACPGTPGNLAECTGTINVASPGTVSWQGSTNIETHARTISGNGITQVWSGVVTTGNCNNRATFTVDNTVTDCRNSINGFDGDYFNFCFVMRYQDQLCPGNWRVPTGQDFINLDVAMGGTGENRGVTNDATSNGWTGTAASEKYTGTAAGTWGGAYITGLASSLTTNSYFFSSSMFDIVGTNLYTLAYNRNLVYPNNSLSPKNEGFPLRCVRDN